MDEASIARVLRHDSSAGTEEFREDLLRRCLAVLASGGDREGGADLPEPADCRLLEDSELDMLAAAGDLAMREDRYSHED